MPLIEPLSDHHDRSRFDCGNADLNRWFLQVAKQHREKHLSRTFVAVAQRSGSEVLGFYALTAAELLNEDLPESHRKRLPRRMPVFRLGRLATSVQCRGRGVGEYLLFDAIDRCKAAQEHVGGVALIVDTKPEAESFYRRYGFLPTGGQPDQFLLLL